jgi:hypothetical protein
MATLTRQRTTEAIRRGFFTFLFAATALLAGCESRPFDGPTVDEFDGRLVHNGQPVKFEEGEQVVLQMFHHGTAESFGVPIKSDGSFDIGWMPIGEYSATLKRTPASGAGAARGGAGADAVAPYQLPENPKIAEGQTKFDIELGKNWKP